MPVYWELLQRTKIIDGRGADVFHVQTVVTGLKATFLTEIGETKTLDELIAQSLLNDAFVVVDVVDGMTMAIYRCHGSDQAELWQAVPGAAKPPLMQFLYVIDIRNYPQYL